MVKLSANVIISDIAPNLKRAEEYIRNVLGNMHACKKKYGTATVRIGITGRGIAPHYRVEPILDMATFTGRFEDYFAAYDGRNHQKFEWGVFELKNEHWSDKEMTYEEVQSLLGSIRNPDPKKSGDN